MASIRDKLVNLILETLRELNEDLDLDAFGDPGPETRIFGQDGGLDSVALVALMADLEEKVAREFRRDIIIADDRAMSRKRSPFRSVSTLADYLEELMEKEESGPRTN